MRVIPDQKPRFCIAIEEGDAWLLGDLPAVRRAYPNARDEVLNSYINDSICGTWEVLADAVYRGGAKELSRNGWHVIGTEESRWAEAISTGMGVGNNASPGFFGKIRSSRNPRNARRVVSGKSHMKVTMLKQLLFLVPAALFAQTPAPPTAADHQALIALMRDAALNYADRLQDFLCTQFTTRTVDTSGTGNRWKLLETQELELGYITHNEHYRLLKVNGKDRDPAKKIKKGYWNPGGEFGSSLLYIFAPKVAAEFEWDHEESAAGTRSCGFRYRVPVATSSYVIQADLDHVRMAHHGFVTADCETGAVMRIQMETEPASVKRVGRDYAIGMTLDLQYRQAAIGGKGYLLPQWATETGIFGKTLTKVEIQFRDYRKYDSSSNILFDDGSVMSN